MNHVFPPTFLTSYVQDTKAHAAFSQFKCTVSPFKAQKPGTGFPPNSTEAEKELFFFMYPIQIHKTVLLNIQRPEPIPWLRAKC